MTEKPIIKVYTTSTCVYCQVVKKYLTMRGKKFEVINLDNNPELRQELINKTGVMTVPVTEYNGQFVVGWNPSQLASL